MWTHREDVITAAIIDRAVSILEADGEFFATLFMTEHGMSASTMARICSGRRRALGTQHNIAAVPKVSASSRA
jgi:hypothetical protein